jgi:hypothetical protein
LHADDQGRFDAPANDVHDPEGDPFANFRAEVELYARIDPMPTLENLSRATGIPVELLVRYVLVKWGASGSEALLAMGPIVFEQMEGHVREAERAGTDEARLRAYDALRLMVGWLRAGAAATVLACLVLVSSCSEILPSTSGFRETRYYATGEVRPGSTDYSILFCADGRVDMVMADQAVYGTYRLGRNEVVVRTQYNEVRFELSRDAATLTPERGGMSLQRKREREGPGVSCADVERIVGRNGE